MTNKTGLYIGGAMLTIWAIVTTVALFQYVTSIPPGIPFKNLTGFVYSVACHRDDWWLAYMEWKFYEKSIGAFVIFVTLWLALFSQEFPQITSRAMIALPIIITVSTAINPATSKKAYWSAWKSANQAVYENSIGKCDNACLLKAYADGEKLIDGIGGTGDLSQILAKLEEK